VLITLEDNPVRPKLELKGGLNSVQLMSILLVTVVKVVTDVVVVVVDVVVVVAVVVVVVDVVVVEDAVVVVVVEVDLMQQSTRKVPETVCSQSDPDSAFNQWSQFVSPVSVAPSDSYIIFRGKQ